MTKNHAKPTKKVLVVDDDAGIRESVRLALAEQDYLNIEVTECADVDTGIHQMTFIIPDVVILDLHMPGKNGWDFLDAMRKDKRLANTKVIMLTVDDTLDNIFKGEEKGIEVYQFLGKPFNIAELQSLVLNLCSPIKK